MKGNQNKLVKTYVWVHWLGCCGSANATSTLRWGGWEKYLGDGGATTKTPSMAQIFPEYEPEKI